MNHSFAAQVYRAQLPALYVGDVRDPETTAFARDARALRTSFLQRGMFETSPSYYYQLVAWLAALLITALWLTVATPHKLCGAVVLGCFWQQSAFAGHDIGHNAITHEVAPVTMPGHSGIDASRLNLETSCFH